jgi:CRISPR-associated protein Cmr5
MRTNSQQQAEAIYDLIIAIKGCENQKRYGALCHRFPLIIRENGLAAAFGFLAAKGKPDSPENLLLAHYATVMGSGSVDTLRQSSISADLSEYRRMTRTALQAAEWFKRYAEAILKVDSTGAGEEDKENSDA